jgi:hypothetical protein
MAEQNKAVVERAFDELNKKNAAVYLELFAPEYFWHHQPPLFRCHRAYLVNLHGAIPAPPGLDSHHKALIGVPKPLTSGNGESISKAEGQMPASLFDSNY